MTVASRPVVSVALDSHPKRADYAERARLALAAGRHDEAVSNIRAAMAVDPDPDPIRARLELGKSLLLIGEFAQGFPELSYSWAGRNDPWVWAGQRLTRGETLLLHCTRSGFGDAIQWCRYVPLAAARGARVVMSVRPGMERLLAPLEGLTEVFSQPRWRLPLQYYYLPVDGLPNAFGATLENIRATVPYLKGDVGPWREFLDSLPGLKIGVCWAGKQGDTPTYAQMDAHRSMRLADMAPLLTTLGCSFVSLQLGPPAAQRRALPPAVRLFDVSHRIADWADTAGLIAGLDLVITVDTAVAHLAGALGRPVWMLNKYLTCWRWMLDRPDSPWYPTMRIFRQGAPGAWGSVVAEVAQCLQSSTLRSHHTEYN